MVMIAMATYSSWRELNSAVVSAFLFSSALLSTIAFGQSTAGAPPNALFVFGDSYLDTGNHNKSVGLNRPWLAPYGKTWYPGKPTGRFSDGRVFTDIFASALQMASPVPYEHRLTEVGAAKYGMNFALGGSGVFNPYGMLNLRGQVDQFQSLMNNLYPREFLQSSLVLIGIHGNDYGAYLAKGNPLSGLAAYQKSAVNEMAVQLERLNKLGFKTFYINNLQPVGCLPSTTLPDYKVCSEISNAIVSSPHNNFLAASVADLKKRLPRASFTILDHFTAFTTVLQNPAKFGMSADPLKPCCLGEVNTLKSCGDVDPTGKPMYTVCSNAAKSFFWDTIHPSQAGWTAVTKLLFPNASL